MALLRPVIVSSVIVLTIDNQNFQWVLSVMDLSSRFVWLRALQSKSSDEVAIKLRDIYTEFETPNFCTI